MIRNIHIIAILCIGLLIAIAGFWLHDNVFKSGVIIFMLGVLVEYLDKSTIDIDVEIKKLSKILKGQVL